MNITSKNLKGGLYGQLLLWPLELLPHLKKSNIIPTWDIKSEYYGEAPDYNIFGKYILSNKKTNISTESFDLLSLKINNVDFFESFKGNFNRANKFFFEYFSFSDEIVSEVETIITQYNEKNILGLHYRGTDKIGTEGGYINVDIFKKIVDDYLINNKIDTIFIFSDEINTAKTLEEYYSNKYLVKNFNEGESNNLVFNNNNNNNKPNGLLYKKTIVDSLILSKCDVVFKTASQFSGWAKIFNPELNIYLISAFKEDWFPDSYIPLYTSDNSEIQNILDEIYSEGK